MRQRLHPLSLLLAVPALVFGCEDEPSTYQSTYDGPPIPWEYAAFPKVMAPAENPSSPAKVTLGFDLFYDPILSRDSQVACATCHSEIWGMSDGLPVSIGVDGVGPVGPGRVGPNVTTRNAPTLWNVAFRGELFWDGRTQALEEQALHPLDQPNEMAQSPEVAVQRIKGVPEYVAMFEAAFPEDEDPVSPTNLARALAAFERTMITNRGPYDQYVAGDLGAMTDSEKRGMKLFGAEGCDACHTPPLFESLRYVKRFPSSDAGRYAVSGLSRDRSAFRVPTLRNVRESGPYFHDGHQSDLRDATEEEVATQIEAGLAQPLSADQMADLVRFLHDSLTDQVQAPRRPVDVPSGLPVPVDGFRVDR